MERKQRYGLRKLSIGVVSCFLGSVIYFGAGMTVNAEEIQPDNMEETASSDALAETSSDPILEESTPAEEAPATALAAPQEAAPADPVLKTNENGYAKEYDDYDVSETWSKDDTLDMSQSAGSYYWKNNK